MRDKVAVVLDKTQNDDRLIAALRLEVAGLRRGGPAGGASGWSPKGSPKAADAGRGGGGLKGETSSRCGRPGRHIMSMPMSM